MAKPGYVGFLIKQWLIHYYNDGNGLQTFTFGTSISDLGHLDQQKNGKFLFLFGNYQTQMEIIRSSSVRDSKTGSDQGGI